MSQQTDQLARSSKLLILIALLLSVIVLFLMVIDVIQKKPPEFVFESDVVVVRQKQRTCLKSGDTFQIKQAHNGWMIRCNN